MPKRSVVMGFGKRCTFVVYYPEWSQWYKKKKKNSDIWLLVALKPKEFRYIGSVTEPLYNDFITSRYLEYDTKQKEEEHACSFLKRKV